MRVLLTQAGLACRALLILLAGGMAFLFPFCGMAADPAPWQVPSAPARFLVDLDKIDQPGTVSWVRIGLPDARWATMPVSAFDSKGNAVGAKVIWSASGEMTTIAFDSTARDKRYFFYFGSATPPSTAAWTPQAGVLLETRPGESKPMNRLDQMQAAWKKSGSVIGRSLISNIFEGGHRHGPQDDLFLYFQGWFDVPAAAKYEFSIFSTDASFLLIDGKPLVEWPGRHHYDPGRTGKFRNAIDLTAGPHTVEYYNAYNYRNEGRPPIVCCLAVKAGDAEWQILRGDSTFFRPISRAHVAGYELIPDGLAATSGVMTAPAPLLGFEWEIAEQSVPSAEATDSGFVLMKFRFYRARSNWTCTWSFDDGTTGTESKVEHLYLRPGMRQVKLTVRQGDAEFASVTVPVNVHANWSQLSTRRPELNPKHRETLFARDLATISASDLASVVTLFQVFEDVDGLVKVAPSVGAKVKDASDADLPAFQKAAVYLASGEVRKPAEATIYLQGLIESGTGTASPAAKTIANQSRLVLAQLILRTSDRVDEARELAKAIDAGALVPDEQRALNIFWANVALASGDIAGAKKQYLALTADPTGADARSSIRRTAKIDQANKFMEKKDFFSAEKALEDIEWPSPIDKLSSDCVLARVRLYQERGDTVAAYIWAKRLLPVIVDASARSQLLFRLTDLAFAQGDRELARKCLRELVQKFPYSESTAQAKGKWPNEIEAKK